MLPVFDYCDAVWTPISVLLTKRLERIHSSFLKGISACSSYVKQRGDVFILLCKCLKFYIICLSGI